MAQQKSKPQDVTPGTFSQVRPGTPVIPLTQEEDAAWNDLARQQGVSKAEAIRKMTEMIPPIPQHPPKKSIVNETLGTIQEARNLNLIDSDQKDPLNQVIKYGLFKDLKKDMKKGEEDRMSPREMMEMNMVNMQMLIMQKSMGSDNNNNNQSNPPQLQQMMQKYDQTIADLRAENEKTRQFYEQKQKEQEEKFKDIILEKRMKDIEENQEKGLQTLSQQISDVYDQIKTYQNIPQAPTADQKKDAIAHLEEMGGTLERIKKALPMLGINTQGGQGGAAAAGSAISPYRNPDGTMNMTLYGIDQATNIAGKLLEAWSRKAPEPKQVQLHETQVQAGGSGGNGAGTAAGVGQQLPQKQMTYQEFYIHLLNLPTLTPEQQQWKDSYEDYVTKVQQERSAPKQQINTQPQRQRQPQPETSYTDADTQEQEQVQIQAQVPSQQPEPEEPQEPIQSQSQLQVQIQPEPEPEQQAPPPKKGIVERMREMEAQSSRYTI
jgi:hypothetical protein